MTEMSRAQELLRMIAEMDVEEEPQYSLRGGSTGYNYQGRGTGMPQPNYPDGKRPVGLASKNGKSA